MGVAYLGSDTGLAAELRGRLAEDVGFAAFTEVTSVAQALKGSPASVLVVDVRGASPRRDLTGVFGEIAAAGASLPVWICLSEPGDISARLDALRSGARGCFADPVDADALSGRLLDLCGAAAGSPYRVLVVDDQEVAALFATRVLEKVGMKVRAVADGLTVLDALAEFRPDLILMDLHMPGANGLELTQIIRQQEGFLATPVVFLSGEVDPDRQMAALRVGGDDFLAKPVAVDRLVDTVRRRIETARLAARRAPFAATEASGAGRCGYLLRHIDQAIAAGARTAPGAGVLYLELDQGEQLDMRPGLLDGVLDAVLARLGHALRAGGRSEDLAARVGPRSLALLVACEDGKALAAFAEGVRAAVAGQAWTIDGEGVRLTASVGIGSFLPPADDAITMISRAKKACYGARHHGGNRVEVYAPAVPNPPGPARSKRVADLVQEALRGDGFTLSYQPAVPLRLRPGERYEALLRLRTSDGELIPPFDFLPAARQAGFMPEIDRWVMQRALDDAQRHCGALPGLQVLIRQTLDSAGSHDWVTWLRDEIVRRDLIRHRPALIFDLDDVAAQPDHARVGFAELHRLGIDLCLNHMDDSADALQLLAELPISLVRLYQSAQSEMTSARLVGLVAAVRECGAAVIATGIEDPKAIGRVWGCGVDFIQGNFIQPASEGFDFDFEGFELV
jgi:diguanylate cyclase (GGDEF)-like protein